MRILGISAFYHDSAACILENDRIVAAAQEERFTRIKHDAGFPTNAVTYCLEEAGIGIDDLDAVAFYDKPLLKFERLLETYLSFAPRGLKSFVMAIPVWLKEKMFLKKQIYDGLREIGEYDKKKLKLLFPEHHLSHAASAFFPSNFETAAILTVDGVGEWATASLAKGDGNKITVLKELKFPHSLGLLYSAFTYYLGFKVNSGEYKLMGLAPYGNPNSENTAKFIELIKTRLIQIYDDGSIWLNMDYFDFATGLRMADDKKWEQLFGFPRRKEERELHQYEADLALAIQKVTEEIVLKMALHLQEITGEKNICLAGGVALNCVANGELYKTKKYENIYIQPAAGDAGGALGAALAVYHIYYGKTRVIKAPDSMEGAYLGPKFYPNEIKKVLNRFNTKYEVYEDEELYPFVANVLDSGKVVGWFQGRMEFGPRALGNRSILGDARKTDMQKKLNLKIKYRESFRPFAPAILAEESNKYFEMEAPSPYMLMVHDVAKEFRKDVPDNYHEMALRDKLAVKRSDFPAITHIDFSARVQTVHKETNPEFWNLLNAFKELTGSPVLINTSFNVRGEPIVCTPEDAYNCFMNTEMDYLVMENFVLDKNRQPEWSKKQIFDKD